MNVNHACIQDEANLTLRGGVPVYVHPDEHVSVQRAVADLTRDLESIFDQASPLVSSLPEAGPAIIVATGKRYTGKFPEPEGWEAHQIYADKDRMVLNGADARGTIYAIYMFSEKILGVKPLWFWASMPPEQKTNISIAPNYRLYVSPPDVKYRAWFPNDRDLLNPWQRQSSKNDEAFVETMLRLKLNTLEGSITDEDSFSKPYTLGREAQLAKERGLIVTGHHMKVFGSEYKYWDNYWTQVRKKPIPAIKISDIKSLQEWWHYHIETSLRNDLEVIWLVGFRGNRDIPFWKFFSDAPADESDRAKVIEQMVHLQIDLLKRTTGKTHPPMRLTLYNEMSTLMAKGLFHLPDEPSLIRNFVAARRDHFPAEDLRTHRFSGDAPVGYYMNFQFTSSGSHLAQAEGPWKMKQNYHMVNNRSGGNLIFSVVNAGNIREHVLELSANAAMMWEFQPFQPMAFLKQFCADYYGSKHAAEIARLYQEFYNSYWQQKQADIPGFERQYLFHDLRYARAAEMLLSDLEKGNWSSNPLDGHPQDNPDTGSVGFFRVVPTDNDASNQLEALRKGTTSSTIKLEVVIDKADLLHSKLKKGQTFFNDNLRGQAYFMLHINRMLHDLVCAYQVIADRLQSTQYLQQSLTELQLAQQCLREAEHNRFTDWYKHERIFKINRIEERMQSIYEKMSKS